MRRFDNRLVSALAGFIFKSIEDFVHNGERADFRARFIALGLVVVNFDEVFVALITLGDIIVMVTLILSGRGIFTTLPVVAVDDEHIFDVQIVWK